MAKDQEGTSPTSRVREFTVEVEGYGEFTFCVTMAHFNRFLQESQRDPGRAANNFLLHTCTDRERLNKAFEDDWSLPLQVMGPITEELVPIRQVLVKKQKSSQPN